MEERTMAATVTITGASDDLIEIGGSIIEEFNHYSTNGEPALLGFSDGTLLRVTYDKDGLWRFARLVSGSATFEKTEGDVEKDVNDRIVLTGEIRWVLFGESMATA